MTGMSPALKLFIVILLVSSIVYADGGSFYADGGDTSLVESAFDGTCGLINGSTFVDLIPYYIGVDEYGKLRVSAINAQGEYINNSNSTIQITLDDITYYNMSYDSNETEWFAYFTSNIEEDAEATIYLSSTVYNCINTTYTLRFREPFYVNVLFYTTNKSTGRSESYKDDFHYVYVKPHIDTTQVPNRNDISRVFKATMGWIPGTDSIYDTQLDQTMVMWGEYQYGYARIKLYEANVYDIYLITNKIKVDKTWQFEFIKPQFTDIVLDSKVAEINISEEEDLTAKVYADKWEFDKVGIIMNFVKTFIYIILAILVIGGLAILPGVGKIIAPIAGVLFWAILKMMGVL